jgi:hypothetical protein
MRIKRVLATAIAAAVAVIAATGGTAAFAASPAASTAKGSAVTVISKTGTPGKDRDQEALLRKIAKSLHVSRAKLESALRDVKMTSIKLGVEPTNPAVVKVFAKDLGISYTKALKVLKEIVGDAGKPKPGKPDKGGDQEAFLRKIAASLHVSLATLENALRDVKTTSIKLGVEPTDPAVVKVLAKDLGISTTKALEVIKEIVGKPGPVKSPPSDKPAPPSSGKK